MGQDNTVTLDRVTLQISKQPGRRTCAGLEVLVRRHLDGRYSIWRGTQRLGLFDATGRPVDAAAPVDGRRPALHQPLGSAGRSARRPTAPTAVLWQRVDESGQITCQTKAVNSLVSNTGAPVARRVAIWYSEEFRHPLPGPRAERIAGGAQQSGPLAQLAEQQTLNLRVVGSIPTRLTTIP